MRNIVSRTLETTTEVPIIGFRCKSLKIKCISFCCTALRISCGKKMPKIPKKLAYLRKKQYLCKMYHDFSTEFFFSVLM
jgi:hypothetical protein